MRVERKRLKEKITERREKLKIGSNQKKETREQSDRRK
jgi:hypothetical protein